MVGRGEELAEIVLRGIVGAADDGGGSGGDRKGNKAEEGGGNLVLEGHADVLLAAHHNDTPAGGHCMSHCRARSLFSFSPPLGDGYDQDFVIPTGAEHSEA